MDKIKQCTVLISAVSIISGILLSVIPQGKLRPAYKTLISVVLIYAFMSPLITSGSIDFNIGDYLRSNYELSGSYDKYALQSVTDSAEKAVEQALFDLASASEITCSFSAECVTEGDGVKLKKIIVSGASSPEIRDEIMKLLLDSGFDKEIIIFEDETDEQ